jgi:predicted GNAT family acetyltransferase
MSGNDLGNKPYRGGLEAMVMVVSRTVISHSAEGQGVEARLVYHF